ncbi:hypothetical protein, partial [Helicobacter canadensis]|uniref:hypothetical protein n=1 Tax=Helicobacter canadensis TaxID=123841 RepID=UPI0001978D13
AREKPKHHKQKINHLKNKENLLKLRDSIKFNLLNMNFIYLLFLYLMVLFLMVVLPSCPHFALNYKNSTTMHFIKKSQKIPNFTERYA